MGHYGTKYLLQSCDTRNRACLKKCPDDIALKESYQRAALKFTGSLFSGKIRNRLFTSSLSSSIQDMPGVLRTLRLIFARDKDQADRCLTDLFRDRDKIFGSVIQNRVKAMGIEEVLTAHRSPWQNAYVERVNGSIRRECTDHIVVWNERHLKRTLRDYFDYYNNDRTHLSLVKQTPIDRQVSKRVSRADQLLVIPKVGGLHHRYEWREAA